MLSIRHSRIKRKYDDKRPPVSWLDIKHVIEDRIIEGVYSEGSELPSVRSWASSLNAHHETIRKAFDALADIDVIEKREGRVAQVCFGARERLLLIERDNFLKIEVPRLLLFMKRHELNWEGLEAIAIATLDGKSTSKLP